VYVSASQIRRCELRARRPGERAWRASPRPRRADTAPLVHVEEVNGQKPRGGGGRPLSRISPPRPPQSPALFTADAQGESAGAARVDLLGSPRLRASASSSLPQPPLRPDHCCSAALGLGDRRDRRARPACCWRTSARKEVPQWERCPPLRRRIFAANGRPGSRAKQIHAARSLAMGSREAPGPKPARDVGGAGRLSEPGSPLGYRRPRAAREAAVSGLGGSSTKTAAGRSQ